MSILRNAELREILGIPHHAIPLAYLCVVYPENGFLDEPLLQTNGWGKRLSLDSLVSYEKWGQRTRGNRSRLDATFEGTQVRTV